MDVQCALDCRSLLGEGPVWDVEEQRLYWVDIKRRQIRRFAPDTGADETWPMPEEVGALAPREGGGLVVALRSGFHSYDLIDRRLVPAGGAAAGRTGAQPLQ
jgi:sugar lactone lactonase YvrE